MGGRGGGKDSPEFTGDTDTRETVPISRNYLPSLLLLLLLHFSRDEI